MPKKTSLWKAYILDGKRKRLAGTLAIADGILRVASSAAREEDKAWLNDAVEDLNNRDHLVDLAPPKSTKERYGMGAVEYRRDHPDFEQVLIRKLEEHHSIRMEPAK